MRAERTAEAERVVRQVEVIAGRPRTAAVRIVESDRRSVAPPPDDQGTDHLRGRVGQRPVSEGGRLFLAVRPEPRDVLAHLPEDEVGAVARPRLAGVGSHAEGRRRRTGISVRPALTGIAEHELAGPDERRARIDEQGACAIREDVPWPWRD